MSLKKFRRKTTSQLKALLNILIITKKIIKKCKIDKLKNKEDQQLRSSQNFISLDNIKKSWKWNEENEYKLSQFISEMQTEATSRWCV